MLGELVGSKYRIVALVGSGAMGAVYEAEHVVTGARLAIKVLRPEVGDNPEIRLRFAREVAATGILDHQHVVKVVDSGAAGDGTLFLVMELVRGVSLTDVIRDGQVAPRRALTIARQVLGALTYTHAIGVVHRDLKPDNLMLADGGHPDRDEDLVKLLDFGIAKLVGDAEAELASAKLTQAGVAFGTPWYMAPEQALGQVVDARADLYAVGVILFEMLAGVRPFDHPDRIAILRMQVTQRPPTLAQAAPERTFTPLLEHVIAEALAKRREDRYGSAAEMLAAVDAALASIDQSQPVALVPSFVPSFVPSLADAPTILEPIDLGNALRGRWPRPPVGLIAPVALLVAVVLALVAFSPGRPRSPTPFALTASDRARAGEALLALGHALADGGKTEAAMIVYERAIAVSPSRARAELVAIASAGKDPAARRLALALAEREGFAHEVDQIASAVLDLRQGSTCTERRAAVPRLAESRDARAIPVLRAAAAERRNKCLRRDATRAVQRLRAHT